MRYTELADTAKLRLLDNDDKFHDRAERLVSLMRCSGVVPVRRTSLWGHWHKLLAAMIVTAHDEQTTVDITTRRKGTFADVGLPASMIKWFDNLVEQQMLIPKNGSAKAQGALLLSPSLTEEIQ